MEDVVLLEIYSNEKLIGKKSVELYDWYDGDEIDEIDSDEFRIERNITMIHGTQYDEHVEIYTKWSLQYDSLGRLVQDTLYEDGVNISKIEKYEYDADGKMHSSTQEFK